MCCQDFTRLVHEQGTGLEASTALQAVSRELEGDGGAGGTEPIRGTGLLLPQATSLSLLPRDAFVPFLLSRSPGSEQQPLSSMRQAAGCPRYPARSGWAHPAVWPLPLTSPSLSRVPPQERLRACVRRRGDFHPFPVGAEISWWDRGTSTAQQPSSAGGWPIPQQKGDDAAARLPSERCLPLSPAAPSPKEARRAPEPRDRLCVPRHAAQPRQPCRKSDGCETRA